jgi:hypothetical protein
MHTSALLGDALQHLAAASESRPPLFRGATERAGVWLGPGELPDAKPIVLRCCLPNIAALLHYHRVHHRYTTANFNRSVTADRVRCMPSFPSSLGGGGQLSAHEGSRQLSAKLSMVPGRLRRRAWRAAAEFSLNPPPLFSSL